MAGNIQFDLTALAAFKALGAKVECNDNDCKVTGPGGVTATLSNAQLKSAKDGLAMLGGLTQKTAGLTRFAASAKAATLKTAENFGKSIISLAEHLGAPLVADLLGANLKSSISRFVDEAKSGHMSA